MEKQYELLNCLPGGTDDQKPQDGEDNHQPFQKWHPPETWPIVD